MVGCAWLLRGRKHSLRPEKHNVVDQGESRSLSSQKIGHGGGRNVNEHAVIGNGLQFGLVNDGASDRLDCRAEIACRLQAASWCASEPELHFDTNRAVFLLFRDDSAKPFDRPNNPDGTAPPP